MAVLLTKNLKLYAKKFYWCTRCFSFRKSNEYNTKIVGGVTPEKGGTKHLDVPVFNTVAEAKKLLVVMLVVYLYHHHLQLTQS